LPKGKEWSKEEDDYLTKHYGKMTSAEISSVLGRTKPAVLSRAFALSLHAKKRYWSEMEIAYLRRNYGEILATEIANNLGRTLLAVNGKASELKLRSAITGIGKKLPMAENSINPKLCDSIWRKRKELGLKQRELAKMMGRSHPFVNSSERGLLGSGVKTRECLERWQLEVAEYLGIDTTGLLEDKMETAKRKPATTSESKTLEFIVQKRTKRLEEQDMLESNPAYRLAQVEKEIAYIKSERKKCEDKLAELKKEGEDRSLSIPDMIKRNRTRKREEMGLKDDLEILVAPLDALERARKAYAGVLEKQERDRHRQAAIDVVAILERMQKRQQAQVQAMDSLIADLASKLETFANSEADEDEGICG
jgi:transcriptional regulator with XRE-family HTH domain